MACKVTARLVPARRISGAMPILQGETACCGRIDVGTKTTKTRARSGTPVTAARPVCRPRIALIRVQPITIARVAGRPFRFLSGPAVTANRATASVVSSGIRTIASAPCNRPARARRATLRACADGSARRPLLIGRASWMRRLTVCPSPQMPSLVGGICGATSATCAPRRPQRLTMLSPSAPVARMSRLIFARFAAVATRLRVLATGAHSQPIRKQHDH